MISPRVGLIWSLGERYVNLGVGLAASVVLARLLTPAQVGVFSLCAATVAIAGTVRDFGVADYIVQEKELTQDKMRGAFAVSLTMAWAIGSVVFLTRHLLADYYQDATISSLLAILSISFFILPLASPAYAVLNREMAFRKIFAIQLAATAAQAAVSVVLALRGWGAYSLAWGSVVGVASQAVMVAAMRPAHSLLWPRFRGSAGIFRFGAYQMGSRVLDTVTSTAHEFIIARQFGFAQVGFFSRAKNLVDMFHNNVTTALTRVATPALAHSHRAEESLVHRFSRGTALITSVSWPFFAFLALAAPEVIRVMYGPQWGPAVPIASWLALGMLPTALCTLSGVVMSAMGEVERRLTVSLQWCPVHVLGLAIGSMIGLEAMAMAWGVTNSLIAVLFALQMRKLLRTSLRDLFSASLPSVAILGATVATQSLALYLMRSAQVPALAIVPVAALVGLCAWILAVRALRHPVYDEVRRVAHRIRRHLPLRA